MEVNTDKITIQCKFWDQQKSEINPNPRPLEQKTGN